MLPDALRPHWPAPPSVCALMSTRAGGVSAPPYDSLNLRPAALGGPSDDPAAVEENARRFARALGATPVWLDQVHGAAVVRLGAADLAPGRALHRADASVTTVPGVACAVLVADCLPLLLAHRDGHAVGAAHAGWRGLVAGVIEAAVAATCDAARCAPRDLLAWLGACIGAHAFEVGADVVDACGGRAARFVACRRADGSPGWFADLAGLARDRLGAAGVVAVSGAGGCTFTDPQRFFSYRRDRVTGRMAAAVAIRGRRVHAGARAHDAAAMTSTEPAARR